MARTTRLPVTAASAWEWQYSGACRDADPRLYFHPEGERGPARHQRELRAVAVCIECPVIERCRQHAFSVREPYGVWGGLTEQDREAMQRRPTLRPPAQSRSFAPARDPSRHDARDPSPHDALDPSPHDLARN